MAPRVLITSVALAALAVAPAFAADAQHRRGRAQPGHRSSETKQTAPSPLQSGAVAPSEAPRERVASRQYAGPQDQAPPRYGVPRQQQTPQQNDVQLQYQQRGYAVPRQYETRRGYGGRSFDDRDDRGYYGRRFGSARVIRPTIIEVVPYRPYFYRPSLRIGIYYGAGGSYPYGYTPRGYYDPIPGRYYGGLRITGAPRDAQVFADGYFVGIVDDFDGVFQHLNLEAGPHHIEVAESGFEPIAFDVNVRPGETITFRADMYRPY